MYTIKVYVNHGYFQYEVNDIDRAMAHGEAIMANQVYRRSVNGSVEFHKVFKVKVEGPELDSEYKDTFKRT